MPKATLKDYAATDFEPLSANDAQHLKANLDDWSSTVLTHLPALRVSYELLCKSKPELVECLRAMDVSALDDLRRILTEAEMFLENNVSLLKTAEVRILVAGSVLELEGPTRN
jgi:hypothetical protein